MNAIQMSSGLRPDLRVLAHFPLSSFKNCSDQIPPAFSCTLTTSCQNNHYFLVYPLDCLLNFAEKLLIFEMFASNHEANQAKRSKLSRRRNVSSADLVLKIRVNARAQQKQGFITIVLSSYEALGLLDKMIIWSKVNFGVLTVFCEEEPFLQGA